MGFLGLVISGLSNDQSSISSISPGFKRLHCFKALKLIIFFFFACSMARGQEETSTSQARRKRGTPRESLTASSPVAVMSIEELRSFCQVPANISLELSDEVVVSTIGGADNVVYFTREQFAAEIRFPISSLVKQFLYFTQAPPTLIHPNVFQILMGCNVLNFLYQLDISLVEVCFIYTLKLGIRGRLSMSTHSPWLQFVTRLLPKIEAKWVVLVKGPWYEKPGSLSLPFDLNQSSRFQVCLILMGLVLF